MNKPEKKEPKKNGRPVKWTEQKAMELADELMTWLLASDSNIFFERFLYEQKQLYPQLISELGEKYEKFSEAIKRAKAIQEHKIADLAIKGITNPTMSIFLLKNNFGYKDKHEQNIDHTTGGNPININYIPPANE